VLLPACFYVGIHWGVVGVAWAWVIGFPLSIAPAVVVLARILAMPASAYLRALRPALTACLIMSVAVVLLRQLLPPDWSHAARLAVQAGCGAVVYTVALLSLFFRPVVTIYMTIRDARRA